MSMEYIQSLGTMGGKPAHCFALIREFSFIILQAKIGITGHIPQEHLQLVVLTKGETQEDPAPKGAETSDPDNTNPLPQVFPNSC